MDAKTPRQFLQEILPKAFKPEKTAGIDVVAQLTVIGENGGNWVITLKNQKLQVKEGTAPCPI